MAEAEIPFTTTDIETIGSDLVGFKLGVSWGSTAVTATFETQRLLSDPMEIQSWEILDEIAALTDLLGRLVEQERRKPSGVRPQP